MDETLPVSSVRDRFSEVIDRVLVGGRRVALSRHGRPVAVLVPLSDAEAIAEAEDALDRSEALSALSKLRHDPDTKPAAQFFDAPQMDARITLTTHAAHQLSALPPADVMAFRRMIGGLGASEKQNVRALADDVWSLRERGRRLIFAQCGTQSVVLRLGV